jgi:U3 small nucleolar RNA-associated protein 14
MNDILSSLTDPTLQSLRKSLEAQRQSTASKAAGQKLTAPLAKNIQKKLERQAAYEETKAEITKWQPTVKARREVPPAPMKNR